MRSAFRAACLVVACLSIGPGSLFAQDAPEGQAEKLGQTGAKYEAVIEEDGREVERLFNLKDKKDLTDLTHLLEAGHVEKLQIAEKPVNILAIKSDLGIWTLVVFGLLAFILHKIAWAPMLEGLKKREDNIRTAAEQAVKARQDTEAIRADAKKQVAKAFEEIPQILEKARKDAQALAEELRSKAQADIQADRLRLRQEIEQAKDQALQVIYTQAVDLAALISSKALRRSVTADDHRRLFDEAMAELKNSNQRRTGGAKA